MNEPLHHAAYWVERLALEPHPEGGWFREVYRAAEQMSAAGLPARFDAPRSFSTAIYYLLEAGQFSAFHRIRSDEVWHWYAGGPLDIFVLEENGSLQRLGLGPEEGFIRVVPANRWFAARCPANSPFALVGCTVAPGFAFDDFELADRAVLMRTFPQHTAVIRELTRERS